MVWLVLSKVIREVINMKKLFKLEATEQIDNDSESIIGYFDACAFKEWVETHTWRELERMLNE
jgi:hypothetical protein